MVYDWQQPQKLHIAIHVINDSVSLNPTRSLGIKSLRSSHIGLNGVRLLMSISFRFWSCAVISLID